MFPHVIHGAEKDVYETTAYQLFPVGQRMITPQGNVFRYTQMGATVGVANNLYQGAIDISGHQSQLLPSSLAVGDTTITQLMATTAAVANEYARGTVLIEETANLGHIYPVKSHPAAGIGANCVLTLEDGVTVAVAVTAGAGVVGTMKKNPWKDVIIAPVTTPTAIAAGIPRIIIAASGWGWVQTSGVASCLVSGTWTLGVPLTDGSGAAGSIMPSAAATDTSVATSVELAPAADFGHCYLLID